MSQRACQGGFCHLHLPAATNLPSCSSKQSLSKREKRLLRSIQRDRATKLLQWTLREEEYSRLEENGDLVRLRVNDCKSDGVGTWVKDETVRLARKEHRPELSQLAFAEFASQLDEDLNDTSNSSSGSAPVLLDIPLEDDGGTNCEFLVCGICSTVYDLLEQARELLNSCDEMRQQEDNLASSQVSKSNDRECNNTEPSKPDDDLSETINRIDDIPNGTLKKSKTEGPNSIKWVDGNQQASSPLQSRSPSFHGPVNTTWSEAAPASFVGRKRDRKQMEENSKIRILVAESDDVSYVCIHVLPNHLSDLSNILEYD